MGGIRAPPSSNKDKRMIDKLDTLQTNLYKAEGILEHILDAIGQGNDVHEGAVWAARDLVKDARECAENITLKRVQTGLKQ